MIVSLNYQHLYDFNREWDFQMKTDNDEMNYQDNVSFKQDGSLSALGLAYCVQVIPSKLSLGVTFNFWDDDMFNNEWDKQIHVLNTTQFSDTPPMTNYDYYRYEKYTFSGFNANIGMLWRPNNQLSIGMVLKTPFTADVEHKTFENTSSEPNSVFDEEWDMPMSYGIGFAYRFSDSFTLSADIYRTEWDDFVMKKSDGTEESIITGKDTDESDIDPTHQVRIGAEYLFINPESKVVIPIRGGFFYDPAPTQGSPDDIYGVSLGTGLVYGRYVFDIAGEYRYGNDVGTALVENYDYSHDLSEFRVYSSLIVHFEN
jgi:long-subunit fatty acid transport protein